MLEEIELRIPRASIVAILGPNGSGKSTLCGVISGVVDVLSGELLFEGADIAELSPHDRVNRGLVVVPESRGVFPAVSVDENLSLWLPTRSDRERVYDRFPNLGTRRSLAAGNLSGGEQQMLSLGAFFVRPPQLLVVDEPTLGLAELISQAVIEQLKELAALGTTIVLAEERAKNVLRVADWVATLSQGHVLWCEPRAEVTQDRLAQAYTGTPGVS